MSIGANIRRLRQDKGYTQGDLAEHAGIRLGHISKIERDETDPKISTITKLMEALGCSANALFYDEEEKSSDSALTMMIERTQNLPQDHKNAISKVVEAFCIANGLDEIFKDGKRFALLRDKTPRMTDNLN